MVLPKKTSFNPSDFGDPSTITRLLIVSYFIALALSLIDGANINLLAAPFMSDQAAHLTMRAVMLT
ncbi:MAG: hypothetical protein HKN27_09965, partial [Silicimonas sp.]|nr:hypothetical protein [Silicimonas sp.]